MKNTLSLKKRLQELFYSKLNATHLPEALPLNGRNYYSVWNNFFQYLGFATIFFGIKLWLIGNYGNAIPFWDQWDAEAANLYQPYLKNTLSWTELFSLHNEHRIFTTRLLDLGLLAVNKTWNPLIQMVVNAGLHIIVLVTTVRLLSRVIGLNYGPALLLFSLILFGIPFGWENILTGFQSQFYFVTLFSVIALWQLITKAPFSTGWWGGIAWGILSFLSFASGAFVFAIAMFIHLIFYLAALRRDKKQLFAILILTLLFVLCFWLTPSLGGSGTSASDVFTALKTVLGWPMPSGFIAALIRNSPALLFSIIMFWQRPPAKDYRWFLLAMVAISFGQAVSIGYGRASGCLSPRYLDLYALNILSNFACLISMAQNQFRIQRTFTITATCAWTSVIIIFLGIYAGENLPSELERKRSTSITQVTNTKNYLQTHNYDFLKDKPHLEIPYPSSERLAILLDSPVIRSILPSNINLPLPGSLIRSLPDSAFIPNGYFQSISRPTDSTWGSYTAKGDGEMGTLSIHFKNTVPSGKLEIPVTGYPLNEGIRVEIEQQGRLKPVYIKDNPAESWGIGYASVDDGPFSIRVTDSSASKWLAIGYPYVVGRLDKQTNNLLSHYYIIIMAGLGILVFGMVQNNLKLGVFQQKSQSTFQPIHNNS